MDFIHHWESPLGGITLASDGEALVGLWFDGQRHYGEMLDANACERALPIFDEAERWLEIYFSGVAPDFTPRLRMRATAFRGAVWETLLTLPFGQTATYGQIAARVAGRMGRERVSPRAVGGAVGHNAIALIIPCHGVVGSGGSLTGYAGGIERKRRLLRMERDSQFLDNPPVAPYN